MSNVYEGMTDECLLDHVYREYENFETGFYDGQFDEHTIEHNFQDFCVAVTEAYNRDLISGTGSIIMRGVRDD